MGNKAVRPKGLVTGRGMALGGSCLPPQKEMKQQNVWPV